MSRDRSPSGTTVLAGAVLSLLALGSLLAAPAPLFAAEEEHLGPHNTYPSEPCQPCHATASGPARMGRYAMPPPPAGARTWLVSPGALCWPCHRWGGPTSASPMEGHAFDDGAHGLERGRVNVPSSWVLGKAELEGRAESGLPYAANAVWPLHCTSCHNVHDVRNRPFLQRERIAALCRECHPGRVNRGKVGIENTGSHDRPTSSHPTDVPVWDISENGTTALVPVDPRLRVTTKSLEQRDRWVLGGKLADPTSADTARTPFSCQTCHTVHGAADRPGEHYPGLLSIWEEDDPSALCLGCHSKEHDKMAFADGMEVQHPVGGKRGTGFYPPRFSSPKGIPEAWTAESHFDGGATPFDPGKREPPFCTSCHDVHGGLPGTSILFGPNPVDGGKGDWCYSCHPEESFNGYAP